MSLIRSVNILPLKPQIKMKPNEKCWCGSDKKWKKCHAVREKEEKLKKSEMFFVEKESVCAAAECLHPTGCKKDPISSHTVQRSIGLNAISIEHHVLTFMGGLSEIMRHSGSLKAHKQSVKQASTFPGFCTDHDGELFAPIEKKEWVESKENAFLFSLRAVSYEVFTKRRAIFSTKKLKETTDRGVNFLIQCQIQNFFYYHIYGLELGLSDGLKWKSLYDQCYINNNYDNYHYMSIQTNAILPIAGCGGFHVDYDFQGNLIQDITSDINCQHITINATSNKNNGLIILGWIGEKDGPAKKFLEGFKELPHEIKISTIIKIFFEYIENVYFNAEWWNSLSNHKKKYIESRVEYTSKFNERNPDCLKPDNVHLFDCGFIESEIFI